MSDDTDNVWTDEDTRRMHADFARKGTPMGHLLNLINDPQCPVGLREMTVEALLRLGYRQEDLQ